MVKLHKAIIKYKHERLGWHTHTIEIFKDKHNMYCLYKDCFLVKRYKTIHACFNVYCKRVYINIPSATDCDITYYNVVCYEYNKGE